MSRLSYNELATLLKLAAATYPTGSFIRHNTSAAIYKVVGHAIREDDNAVLVHYSPQEVCIAEGDADPGKIVFSRPFEEFGEQVDLGYNDRFSPVEAGYGWMEKKK